MEQLTTIQNLARDHLGIQLPSTENEIKAAFRAKSKEVHPDHGGSAASFIQLKDIYRLLDEWPRNDGRIYSVNEAKNSIGHTVDGTPLHALGKGERKKWGDTPIKCPDCKGMGYTANTDVPDGPRYFTCFDCGGTGEIYVWNPVLRSSDIMI